MYALIMQNRISINITSNPYIDYAYYKGITPDAHVEVLTPGMGIDRAYYIMKETGKVLGRLHGVLRGTILRKTDISRRLIAEAAKRAAMTVGAKAYNKAVSIRDGKELPDNNEQDALNKVLKGRIAGYSELLETIRLSGIFLEKDVLDVLQVMYLKGNIEIFPSIIIERHGRDCRCALCGCSIPFNSSSKDSEEMERGICKNCGGALDGYEPLYAAAYDENIYYKKVPLLAPALKKRLHLSIQEYNASKELCSFMDDGRRECLVWMVPGVSGTNIILEAVKKIILRGGRVLVSVPCSSMAKGIDIGKVPGVDVCTFEETAHFYSAFNMAVLYEPPEFKEKGPENFRIPALRALKNGGKLVTITSFPDYESWSSVEKGNAKIIFLPVASDGSLFSEPRIMIYRGLSERNIFIPREVEEFIRWSLSQKMSVCIPVPDDYIASAIKDELSGMDFSAVSVISYPQMDWSKKTDSVIVFFADREDIFNERVLNYCSMLPKITGGKPTGDILYVGASESDEMYRSKSMLRQFNKKAWEMGYIK